MRRDRKNFMNMPEHWRMCAMRLCRCFPKKLEEAGMQKLFDEIEMPVSRVLYEMEKRGRAGAQTGAAGIR